MLEKDARRGTRRLSEEAVGWGARFEPGRGLAALILSLVVVLVLGCSRDNKTGETSAGLRAQYRTLEEVPAQMRESAEVLAARLERQIIEQDMDGVCQAFDFEALIGRMMEGVNGSSASLTSFKSGMRKGIRGTVERSFTLWSEQSPKLKGLAIYRGELTARFRFVAEDKGVAFVDLVMQKNKAGELKVVNFCNRAMGYDLAEQMRQLSIPVLAGLDQGFLERLVNRSEVSPAEMKKLTGMSDSLRAGDHAGVIRGYESLGPSLREGMSATSMYLMALQETGELEKYKAALKEAGARFKDSSFQFMLVDVYALEKEYGKAADCMDAFMAMVGQDAVLLTLKSMMVSAGGDAATARQVLREALALEPDCEYAHANGLDVLLAAKDWDGVRQSMVFLEKNAGYDFKGQLTDEVWAEFRKRPQSAAWR